MDLDEKNMRTSDHIERAKSKEGDSKPNENVTAEEDFAAVEKRLVRKLDLTLVPMVWLLYLFNYLDRNNIALVRVAYHTET